MPIYRFTHNSREVVRLANEHAIRLLASPRVRWPSWRRYLQSAAAEAVIRPHHVLLGVATGPRGIAKSILESFTELSQFTRSIEALLPPLPHLLVSADRKLPLAPASQALVEIAIDEAGNLQNNWVGTEHLLLALCRCNNRVVCNALKAIGLRYDSVLGAVTANMKGRDGDESSTDVDETPKAADQPK